MPLTATIHESEKSVYNACLFACPWFICRRFKLLRLERAWKETVMFELKAAYRNLVAATEECHGKNKLRLPDSETILEVGTFRIRNTKAKKERKKRKRKKERKKERKKRTYNSTLCRAQIFACSFA